MTNLYRNIPIVSIGWNIPIKYPLAAEYGRCRPKMPDKKNETAAAAA
jgi:hypothetical protein